MQYTNKMFDSTAFLYMVMVPPIEESIMKKKKRLTKVKVRLTPLPLYLKWMGRCNLPRRVQADYMGLSYSYYTQVINGHVDASGRFWVQLHTALLQIAEDLESEVIETGDSEEDNIWTGTMIDLLKALAERLHEERLK